MTKGKQYLWSGFALLLLGVVAITMGRMIIEDILGVERQFGEEPMSIKAARYGLVIFTIGVGLMAYGGWKNKKNKA